MTNSPVQPDEAPVDLRKLLKAINDTFNMDELRVLCFNLRVDFDNLQGSTKEQKAISLIQQFSRRNRTNVLVTAFREARPEVSLDEITVEEGDEDPTDNSITLPPLTQTQEKDKTDTLIVGKSLSALIRLMSRPRYA